MAKKEVKNKTTVVGLDLSLTSTGVVILNQESEILEQYTIKSSPQGDLQIDEARRLSTITEKILSGIPGDADLVVIEGIAFMMSKTTALVQLAAINYITRIGLLKMGIPFVIVSPPTLKKFVTGKGVAQKDVMMLETYKRWGVSLTDNNICDAFGLAKIALAILDIDDKLVSEQREVVTLLKKQTPWLGSLDKKFLEG